MKKKRLEQLTMGVLLLGMIIGGFIGMHIAGVTVDFGIAAAIVGTPLLVFLVIFLLNAWRRNRLGTIPEADERTALILKRYFLGVLYFVLFGSGAALLVLYAMGIQAIETGMLLVFMMILYLVIGIGTLIAAKL
ncbi:hypothetical protein NIE88_15075 [Sporolactobacillus shoreicorticis]|uniref:DUF2178 domain-containing protein n=1 Tax=Sporolactobacillus shoreicorticis TaxID=1923877 RepID=A0ABW5S375_9BACL|nr:hypothetical protein [Sporolactobacillus shoreicorticis]MCO7127091.1 hypothetical protein [Sporolactobacillus shoreicorticis]